MKQAAVKQSKTVEKGRGHAAAEPFFTPVQTKLNVSKPGEKLEQEADHAADAVVYGRGPMAGGGVQVSAQMSPIAQRKEEDAQTACETRLSDPAWHQHEPNSEARPGYAEDEPLQMMEDDGAQMKEADAPDETVQAQEEDAAVQVKEDDAAQLMAEDDAQLMSEDSESDVQQKPEDDVQAVNESTEVQKHEEDTTQAKAEEVSVQRRAAKPMLSAKAVRLNRV